MNYFGVERRIKVVNKVIPRDMDRSKMFSIVTPVIDKEELHTYRIYFHTQEITLMKALLGIKVIDFMYDNYNKCIIYKIKATKTQVCLLCESPSFIKIKELK